MTFEAGRAYVIDGSTTQHWVCCVGKCESNKTFKYYSVKHAEDEGWRYTVDTKYVSPYSQVAGHVCPCCTKLLEVLQ